MWLGISLLTVYDFIGSIILMIRAHRKKGEKNKLKKMKRNKIDKSSYFSTNYRTKEDDYRAFQHHNLWGMKNYQMHASHMTMLYLYHRMLFSSYKPKAGKKKLLKYFMKVQTLKGDLSCLPQIGMDGVAIPQPSAKRE